MCEIDVGDELVQHRFEQESGAGIRRPLERFDAFVDVQQGRRRRRELSQKRGKRDLKSDAGNDDPDRRVRRFSLNNQANDSSAANPSTP